MVGTVQVIDTETTMERHALPLTLILLAGCTESPGIVVGPGETAVEEDETCPIIIHEPVTGAQPIGQAVSIQATVTDNIDGDTEVDEDESGVFQATVFFKQETTTTWDSSNLTLIDTSGLYGGSIPGAAISSGGMHYYIYAIDMRRNDCTLPVGGETDPWHFRVYTDR